MRPAAILIPVLALAAGATLAAAGDRPVVIRQQGKVFLPDRVEIDRGDTLLIGNDDPFIHHIFVQAPDMAFDSGEQKPGRDVAIRFDTRGDFVVQCAIHLKMKMAVVVR